MTQTFSLWIEIVFLNHLAGFIESQCMICNHIQPNHLLWSWNLELMSIQRYQRNREKRKYVSIKWTEMSQITWENPRIKDPLWAPTHNVCFYAAKTACVMLKLGSIFDLMLIIKREKSNSMSMMLTEMFQITCEYPSFRAQLQALMPNFHCHTAKSACVKVKLGSVVDLMLQKK